VLMPPNIYDGFCLARRAQFSALSLLSVFEVRKARVHVDGRKLFSGALELPPPSVAGSGEITFRGFPRVEITRKSLLVFITHEQWQRSRTLLLRIHLHHHRKARSPACSHGLHFRSRFSLRYCIMSTTNCARLPPSGMRWCAGVYAFIKETFFPLARLLACIVPLWLLFSLRNVDSWP
jgi:hypothetical protein